jgi:hypothetical protein
VLRVLAKTVVISNNRGGMWETQTKKQRPSRGSNADREASTVQQVNVKSFTSDYDINAFQRQLEEEDRRGKEMAEEKLRFKEAKERQRNERKQLAKEEKRKRKEIEKALVRADKQEKRDAEKCAKANIAAKANATESLWSASQPAKMTKNLKRKLKKQEKRVEGGGGGMKEDSAGNNDQSKHRRWGDDFVFILKHFAVLVFAMFLFHLLLKSTALANVRGGGSYPSV